MWLRSNWPRSNWTASYWYGPALASPGQGLPPVTARPDRMAAIQRDDEEVMMAVITLLASLKA